jgi:hypothetical protein
LGFSVDEVIHHHDVLFTIIWTRAGVAGLDLNVGDTRVLEHDAKEGQAPIARQMMYMKQVRRMLFLTLFPDLG